MCGAVREYVSVHSSLSVALLHIDRDCIGGLLVLRLLRPPSWLCACHKMLSLGVCWRHCSTAPRSSFCTRASRCSLFGGKQRQQRQLLWLVIGVLLGVLVDGAWSARVGDYGRNDYRATTLGK